MEEFQAAEREGTAIRAAIRKLGDASAIEETNSLTIEWIKTDGDLETAGLSLQLSSPVEDATLASIGESTTFRGVEIAQATLSVNGQSAVQDVAVFTQNLLKPLGDARSYVKEVSIELESSGVTVFLKTTFVPSNDDLRKLLYEQLNEATQRKASARNNLRSKNGETKKKSVSFGGFLNTKDEPAKAPSKLLVWFQTAVAIAPRVKNYVFFAVFVFASNYRGHLLALPEPV